MARKEFDRIMTMRGEYVDPRPDLVEGIFYVDKSICFNKCCKSKEKYAATAEDFNTIFIYDRKSLFLFDHETCFRKNIVLMTHANLFEGIIVLAIFLNSVVLAITDYSDRSNDTEFNM